jgi:DNA-3-methyladenine glycosylase II
MYDLERATAEVAAADPVLGQFIARAGPFAPRPSEGDAFRSLARAICFQQLAGRAAAAIFRRTIAAVGGALSPSAILATPAEDLRRAGLSQAKIASLLDLATKSADGALELDGLAGLPDEEVVRRLVTVRGIGRWTAQMFLLFELQRPDVWPVDDLGVRAGYSLIHRLPDTIHPRGLERAGDRYRPYRTVVALYCWHALHLERGTQPITG